MIELGFGVSGVGFVTDGLEEVGGGRWGGGWAVPEGVELASIEEAKEEGRGHT
jgi:hypothetical protein